MSIKKLLFLFFVLFLSISTAAQVLYSRYQVIDTLNSHAISEDISDYNTELDFNGDGINEIVTFNSAESPQKIKILKNDFSVLKVIKASSKYDMFDLTYNSIIKRGKKEDLLVPYLNVKRHKLELKIISFENNSFTLRTIYSLNYSHKIVCYYKTLIVPNRYFIIAINVANPIGRNYRRVLAFNLSNYKLRWEIRTADYILKIFYSPKYPDRFFYGTLAYIPKIYYSHKTFYRTERSLKRTFIDTSFTKRVYPHPDSTASDFSTDIYSYLAICSFKGKYISRIKLGNGLMKFRNASLTNDSTALILTYNNGTRTHTLFRFNLYDNRLSNLINLPKSKFLFRLLGKSIFAKRRDSLREYEFYNNTLKFKREIILGTGEAKLLFIRKVKGLYFLFGDYVVIRDSNFTTIAQMPNNRFYDVEYSEALKCFILKSYRQVTFFKLREASFFERIPPRFWKTLLKVVSLLLIVVIFLWIFTLGKSRKLIRRQNKELLRNQEILEKTTAQLIHSEKLALLGTIAAGFAHQLNSPIGAIKNSAERLAKKTTVDENLDLILRSVEYMRTVVGKFLYASRPAKEGEKECVDFVDAWENWFYLFDREFSIHGIKIITNFERGTCYVKIKQSELFEVISNLMFNARDALLESSKEEKNIEIVAVNGSDFCEFHFIDSGKGVPPEIQNTIFSPFVTTKKRGRGTGLGLWIIKRLIDKVGGEITFENSVKGAIFKVKILKCNYQRG